MQLSNSRSLFFIIGLLVGGTLIYALSPNESPSDQRDHATTASFPERVPDGRLAIYLTPDEQDHISAEMLAFLQGVHAISAGFAEDDRLLIKETALDLSQGAGDGMGRAMREKLPGPFRQLGQELRGDFAALATDADSLAAPELQQAFSDALGRCVACHGSYSVVEVETFP